MTDFSVPAIVDHSEFGTLPGELGLVAMFKGLRRALRGIVIPPRWPMMGDESGDDCSASVEWCRFVHDLEKSRPRDRRGTDTGVA